MRQAYAWYYGNVHDSWPMTQAETLARCAGSNASCQNMCTMRSKNLSMHI